jgi:hypothetical protein
MDINYQYQYPRIILGNQGNIRGFPQKGKGMPVSQRNMAKERPVPDARRVQLKQKKTLMAIIFSKKING